MKMKKFLALAMSACMIFSMTSVAFAVVHGTEANPEVLTELTGDTITVPGGTNTDGYEGYYYNYTMPSDTEGTVQLSFTVDEASTELYLFNVDNLTNTEQYVQIAPDYYGTNTGSIKAAANDVIQIKIMSMAEWNDDWSVATYPELEITWSAEVATVGTATSPEVIETLNQYGSYQTDIEAVVIPNTDGYYFTYEAEVLGTLSLYINENATVDPSVAYPDWNEPDPMLVDSIDELKPEIILTNEDMGVSKKYSDGTTELVVGTGYGAETYNVIQIPVTTGDIVTIQLSSAATGYDDGVNMVCGLLLEEPYGAAGNPVLVTENNTEVTIPAGQCYYVSIDNYSLQPYPISVEGGEAAIYDYYGEAMEGQTDLTITETQISMWEYVFMFKIENQSEEDITYTITFDMPIGISENPEVLDTNDTGEVSFEEGNTDYYFYTWTAPADGIVKFTVDSDADWMYAVYDDDYNIFIGNIYSTSDDIQHAALDVPEGLKLNIQVSAINYDEYAVNKDTTVTTKVEFVESVGTIMDSEEVETIISDIEAGEYDETGVIEIEMGDATVIPAEILNAIKDYNESLVNDYGAEPIDFTIVIISDIYAWTLTNIETVVPVDLGVEVDKADIDEDVIEEVAQGNKYEVLSIAHNGAFGFDAELTFSVVDEYVGLTFALYWYNDGEFELIGKSVADEDGMISFAMDHASDYVLVAEGTATEDDTDTDNDTDTDTDTDADTDTDTDADTDTDETTPDTGDNTSVGMLLMMAGFAAVVVLFTKKRNVVE